MSFLEILYASLNFSVCQRREKGMFFWNAGRRRGGVRRSESNFGCVSVELQLRHFLVNPSSFVDPIINLCV